MSKHLAWSTSRPWPFNAPTPRRFSQSSGAKLLASLMVAMLLVSNLFSLVLVQAASPDGPVWAWGKNDFGQVGDGTNTNSNIPVLTSLPAGVTAKAIATGGFHSQAIGSDNRLYAWGNNQAGELGNGTNTDTNRPVVVALPAGVTAKAIAAGGFHSLAIGSDNQLYAWGFNLYGQLGNGTNTDSNTPVLTLLPAGVIPKVIAAGNIHNLTIGNDNQLYAWGGNFDGELGVGDGGDTDIPFPISTSLPARVIPTAIATGAFYSLAILAPIKQDQTITFNLPNFNYYPYPSGTNTFSLGANATSGLPVSFSASGACTVSGTTVTVTGVGACVITASQAGNSNYNPATPVSRTFQSGPSPTGFDLLSLGPVNMTSTQTQGPIAALGDSIFQGTNLAYGFNGPNAVAVQGNVSFGNWGNTVNGNVVYSGSISRRFVTFRRGGFVQNPNALLPAVKDYALKVSAAWAALSANGMVDYKPWNQLILTGTNPTQNVFTVDGAKLAVANSLLINAPSGSTVILNISGANDRLQYMGISLNGPRAGRVVYNFYQATSLTIQGVGVNGTIWAPAAAVKFTSASITGSVIAGSMTDSSSQYQTEPFHGALPAVQ